MITIILLFYRIITVNQDPLLFFQNHFIDILNITFFFIYKQFIIYISFILHLYIVFNHKHKVLKFCISNIQLSIIYLTNEKYHLTLFTLFKSWRILSLAFISFLYAHGFTMLSVRQPIKTYFFFHPTIGKISKP